MNQIKNLKKLSGLSYFDKAALSQYVVTSENTLAANIKRWLKGGRLIQLKKGLYVTDDYLVSRPDREGYAEFLAEKLYTPSYLSLEYILQKHGMLSEAVQSFTSVTLKPTRLFSNAIGVFSYRRMKRELFGGYKIVRRGEYTIKIADKPKALFDWLYLAVLRHPSPDSSWLHSLRLNLDGFSSRDLKAFSDYCDRSGHQKVRALPQLLRRLK